MSAFWSIISLLGKKKEQMGTSASGEWYNKRGTTTHNRKLIRSSSRHKFASPLLAVLSLVIHIMLLRDKSKVWDSNTVLWYIYIFFIPNNKQKCPHGRGRMVGIAPGMCVTRSSSTHPQNYITHVWVEGFSHGSASPMISQMSRIHWPIDWC